MRASREVIYFNEYKSDYFQGVIVVLGASSEAAHSGFLAKNFFSLTQFTYLDPNLPPPLILNLKLPSFSSLRHNRTHTDLNLNRR